MAADRFRLRLFVAGTSPRSLRTIESLRRLCAAHLRDRHELEVIDIYQQADLATSVGVVAAPTLVRMEPLPLRRITGDLSDEARVLAWLGLGGPGLAGPVLAEPELAGPDVAGPGLATSEHVDGQ